MKKKKPVATNRTPILKQAFRLMLLCTLAFSAASCSSNDNRTKHSKKTVSKKKKAVKKKAEWPLLTDENVAGILEKYGKENPENHVVISTEMGEIKIRLYKGTPLHRANFLMLTKRGYFNDSQFYRVMKDFVIQGGDTDDYSFAKKKRKIGSYTIPSEINPEQYFHKKGAIAMARELKNNPSKRSSSYDFYISMGPKQTEDQLLGFQLADRTLKFSEKVKQVYKTRGGIPGLDGDFTVFGEVVEGMDVLEKMAEVEVSGEDSWPVKSIYMQAKAVK